MGPIFRIIPARAVAKPQGAMKLKVPFWKVALGVAHLAFLTLGATVTAAEAEHKSVTVRHPNLLLNQTEIDQIKLKVRDHPWAARLLDRVKAKAEKDGPAVEAALAYVLTGQTNYARRVRNRLMSEAREQMRHYEK